MARQWKEVVRLTLEGPRFADHAIHLPALQELLHYQKIITETAVGLWWAKNQDAGQLPDNFKEKTILRLKEIGEGSASVLMEAQLEEPESGELPLGVARSLDPVEEAIEVVTVTIDRVRNDQALPEELPKNVIPLLAYWGRSLAEDELIGIQNPRHPKVTFTSRERARVINFVEKKYEDTIDIIGTVLAADVKKNRFVIYLNPKDHDGIQVGKFAPEQEAVITEALKEHQTRRLRVKGKGEYALPEGKLRAITHIDELILPPIGETPFDPTARPIWEEIIEIAERIPEEELDKLPRDLSANLDHYLYGAPKR